LHLPATPPLLGFPPLGDISVSTLEINWISKEKKKAEGSGFRLPSVYIVLSDLLQVLWSQDQEKLIEKNKMRVARKCRSSQAQSEQKKSHCTHRNRTSQPLRSSLVQFSDKKLDMSALV